MKEEKNNKIETPQMRGLEVTPQLMRSETKLDYISNRSIKDSMKEQKQKGRK